MQEKEKIIIIDGHSILNRAYFGMPHLSSKDGTPTGAIYGFLNMLFSYIENENPDYIAIAFDLKEKTFRHKMYDGYKATRKPSDEELRVQVPLIKEVLSLMNIKVLTKAGFEADDIIGTVGKVAGKENINAIIISGDRDLFQLVDDNISIFHVHGKMETTLITKDALKEKYGLNADEFVVLKALMGDASDNIPGVKGVGEKTATPIVLEYKTIENIISNIENIKSKSVREKISNNIDMLKLSYDLSKIETNVPLEINIKDFKMPNLYTKEALEFFKKYDLKKFISKFDDEKEDEIKLPKINIAKDINAIFKEANKQEKLALSVLVNENKNILSYLENKDDFYISLMFDTENVHIIDSSCFEKEDIIKNLVSLFKENRKVFLNDAKTFFKILSIDEIKDFNFVDISLLSYLLKPNLSVHTYDKLAFEYLSLNLLDAKKLKKEVNEILKNDVFVSFTLGEELEKSINEDESLSFVYENIEKPLLFVLFDMEKEGVLIDENELLKNEKELLEITNKLEQEIFELAGEEFNILSPKILGDILFEKLKLPKGKKTKTGYSTDASVLEELSNDYKIAKDVITYRTLMKFRSTYVKGLLEQVASDKRIHTTFNQVTTATGRLSSINPNLQNIPIRLEIGSKLRSAFIPKDGFVFVDADYSQIELRVLAHMSNDEKLIECYNMEKDIHTQTASQVFGVPFEEVTKEQRRNAKAVNFGIIYGISSFGLGKDLSISQKEAKMYIENYFKTFPKIKEFLDNLVEDAKKNGYSKTIFGRKRQIDELLSKNYMMRSFGERVAMNAPIQGSAADIMKIAMIDIYKKLKENNLESKLILQVHDEILVEAKCEEVPIVKNIIKESMENAATLKVPLVVDVNVGNNWLEVH